MSITITLPPGTEERLRAEAAATGKDVGSVVAEAVEARLTSTKLGLRAILSPVHDDFRTSGMTDTELNALLTEAIEETRAERKARPGLPA
jgi:hypothetical protein